MISHTHAARENLQRQGRSRWEERASIPQWEKSSDWLHLLLESLVGDAHGHTTMSGTKRKGRVLSHPRALRKPQELV